MDPVKLDLVWYRNAPQSQSFTLNDDSGDPFDLTGYTLAMQARLYPGATGSAILTLGMAASGSPGFYLDNAGAGQFTMTPPTATTLEALTPLPSATADVTKGQNIWNYDIVLISGGVPEPFVYGSLTLNSGVTV